MRDSTDTQLSNRGLKISFEKSSMPRDWILENNRQLDFELQQLHAKPPRAD
jgi:hypothetical protein